MRKHRLLRGPVFVFQTLTLAPSGKPEGRSLLKTPFKATFMCSAPKIPAPTPAPPPPPPIAPIASPGALASPEGSSRKRTGGMSSLRIADRSAAL